MSDITPTLPASGSGDRNAICEVPPLVLEAHLPPGRTRPRQRCFSAAVSDGRKGILQVTRDVSRHGVSGYQHSA